MKKFIIVLLVSSVSAFTLACQRDQGVFAGNDSDDYQPRPTPAHNPANQEVKGELVRVDMNGNRVAVQLENGIVQTFKVDESAEIVSWLKELQQKHLELRYYEHTPLVKIQSWTDVPRGVPLYENLFTFQNYPVENKLWEDGAPKGLQVEARKTRAKSHYALAVKIVADASMQISITHDRERFTDTSVRRMLGHLHCLLEGIAMDPARRLFELELLSAYEQQSMLDGGNSSVADYALQPQ